MDAEVLQGSQTATASSKHALSSSLSACDPSSRRECRISWETKEFQGRSNQSHSQDCKHHNPFERVKESPNCCSFIAASPPKSTTFSLQQGVVRHTQKRTRVTGESCHFKLPIPMTYVIYVASRGRTLHRHAEALTGQPVVSCFKTFGNKLAKPSSSRDLLRKAITMVQPCPSLFSRPLCLQQGVLGVRGHVKSFRFNLPFRVQG